MARGPRPPAVETRLETDDGVSLWTLRSGDGPVLVTCQGHPGMWDMSHALVRPVRTGRTVVRWDQRGCGRSDPSDVHTVARTLADLAHVVAAAGPGPVVLMGHDWGATLALTYATQHPDQVAGVVYVSGPGIDDPLTWAGEYQRRLLRRLGRQADHFTALRHADRSPELDREYELLRWCASCAEPRQARTAVEAWAQPWLGLNTRAAALLRTETGSRAFLTSLRAAVPRSRTPLLVLAGEHDVRPVGVLTGLVDACPDARLHVVPHAGHLPWLEQPTAYGAAVAGFLARVAPV